MKKSFNLSSEPDIFLYSLIQQVRKCHPGGPPPLAILLPSQSEIPLPSDGFFFRLAGAMGRQRALHTKNSGFAAATLRRHISTFRGNRILFSIRNPYINRFTNHFSIIHNHLTLRKWCYTLLQHDFALDHHFAMLTFIFEPTSVISRY